MGLCILAEVHQDWTPLCDSLVKYYQTRKQTKKKHSKIKWKTSKAEEEEKYVSEKKFNNDAELKKAPNTQKDDRVTGDCLRFH